MSSQILRLYAQHEGVRALQTVLNRREVCTPVVLSGLQGSAVAAVFAAMQAGRVPHLFVLRDAETAGYFYHDLCALLTPEGHPAADGTAEVLFLPTSFRRAIKYGGRDAANEILRTDVISRLAQGGWTHPLYIVTYPDALCEQVARKEEVESRCLTLRQGETHDLGELVQRLLDLGFHRRDYVYEPGEFALRGGILDVFSFSSDYPFRFDFFGDEIETIRTFEVQDQLSLQRLTEASLVPELGSDGQSLVPFTSLLPEETVVVSQGLAYIGQAVERIYQEQFTQSALIAQSDAPPSDEPLLSTALLAPGRVIADALSAFRQVVLTAQALDENSEASGENSEASGENSTASGEKSKAFKEDSKASAETSKAFKENSKAFKETSDAFCIDFQTVRQPLYHKNFDLLRADLSRLAAEGYALHILSDSPKQRERLHALLPEFSLVDAERTLHEGFTDRTLRAAFLTDHQIFDRFHKYTLRSDHARDAKMARSLREMLQFEPGDFVVHADHGIGQFVGLVRMPSPSGEMQEMIKIAYQKGDTVYVSIHSLHKLSKYKGREGEPPRISRLGTGAWEKMKESTKRHIKDIARDLIKLYSQRASEQGFAFSADTYMQQALEASFAYEDTPDQLRVTSEVKADMERPQPMDRLVCGDVGFGKTEIAVRAALKAAVDGKQVAVLVPTTVLALQHFKTFSSRLAQMPVRVDYLSRARSPRETRAVLKDLAEGRIDILIGTHKLIGKSVVWHDLGLLIIDEEQKFGVAVKEKLRSLRTSLDTLTLSATPIPRTLQFSLMGARDLSILQSPPPNRRPVHTEVHEFSAQLIAEAVEFELSRSGQVFIVTPRVATLESLARIVRKYVPDARVAIGHGQMPPAELEKVVIDFINHDSDVLVSTTIVENGVDIPNANTIIIEGAHHFGLADLHQMRGRVGRSSKKAFCYLLAPPLAALPADARRRLEAIEAYSDLGSGIHIALQDLDIRGAGNLLGAEQSGFIADVGYETYQKILAEAMDELRAESLADDSQSPEAATPFAFGANHKASAENQKALGSNQKPSAATREPFGEGQSAAALMPHARQFTSLQIECDLRAYFPETFVPGQAERLMLYRELDNLSTPEALRAYRQRLEDRFGALPEEAEELLRVFSLRQEGARFALEKLTLRQGRMTLHFPASSRHPFWQSTLCNRVIAFAMQHYARCILRDVEGARRLTVQNVHSVRDAVALLQDIAATPV